MNENQSDLQKESTVPAKKGSDFGFYVIMGMFALALVSIVVFSIVSKQ